MNNKVSIATPAAITKVAWRFARKDFRALGKGEDGDRIRMSVNRGLIANFHRQNNTKLNSYDIRHLLQQDKLPDRYTKEYDPDKHYQPSNPVLSPEIAEALLR